MVNNINDSECIDKAHTRTEHYQAPAQRNKSELKDCVIIEHYLKLAKLLRQNTFSKKIVFITSNSNDYGSAPNLKPPYRYRIGGSKYFIL